MANCATRCVSRVHRGFVMRTCNTRTSNEERVIRIMTYRLNG
jgi:hypothetical protein